jgi:hypothetical protein
MPTYEVRDLKTGEDTEIICSYSSLQEKIDSGRFIQVHKSTATIVTHTGSVLGIKKGSGRGNSIHT